MGNPIFFIQQRTGYKCKQFGLIKFRTMNYVRDSSGILLSDYKRLTFLGKFLRKTSIDELPSLINIVKGDLSFIGPRPFIAEYLPLYNQEQKKRYDVKPGISGLAQVNGRNSISWDQKFKFDNEYVRNQSFFLDIKVFFITILKVISMQGTDSSKLDTMSKFKGS